MTFHNAYEIKQNGEKNFIGSTKIGTYKDMSKEEIKEAASNDTPYEVEVETITQNY